MPTPEATAWDNLIEAVATTIPDAQARNIGPDSTIQTNSFSKCIPTSLLSLYAKTNGLHVSGYLPDQYSLPNCTFSLLPVSEIQEWHETMLENHRDRKGIWPFLPHWLKAFTVDEEADGIWDSKWIPFATDGAAGLQFIATGWRRGIYQYSPESFGIRRCGRTLASYLNSVANRMCRGQLQPFDCREENNA